MLKKPGENRQKYRKTIKNLKIGKKQTKISKNRQKYRKIFKNGKKPGQNLQKYRKIIKNVGKCQKKRVRNNEI